jgi:hypothetical protein
MINGLLAIVAALWEFIGRKASVGITVVAAFVLMTVAFLVCIKSLIIGISAALVAPAWIANVIWWFVPSNWSALLASTLSARTCRAAYDMAKEKIKILNEAN